MITKDIQDNFNGDHLARFESRDTYIGDLLQAVMELQARVTEFSGTIVLYGDRILALQARVAALEAQPAQPAPYKNAGLP